MAVAGNVYFIMKKEMKNQKKSVLSLILIGFSMGCADIIPGVSGGTIALITGVYESLLQSISSFNLKALLLLWQRKWKEFADYVSLRFISSLIIGILIAVAVMVRLITFLLHTYPIWTWSFFFGIILTSVIFLIRESSCIKWYFWIAFVIGAGFGYWLVDMVPIETPNTPLFFILSGAIAISAMLLPGISGSFILLLLGKYEAVLTAIQNLLTLTALTVSLERLGCLFVGLLLGLLVFSRLLRALLRHFHDITMFTLAGIIFGSIRKLWPWKEIILQKVVHNRVHILQTQNILPNLYNKEFVIALLFIVLGMACIVLLEKVQKK